MYSVSADYITAESLAVKQFKLSGTCCGEAFSDADILSGSFTVSNQASSPSEITLGAVYVGQLSATFINDLNINRSGWVGGTITVSVGLKLADNSYEYVPIGVYTIAEANHARSGVEVVAYDNMASFDKAVEFDTTYGTVYQLLTALCNECGVTLGMTQLEVEALTNGSRTLGIYQDNDCETYRDLLSNLAAVCCCFATMDRDGELVLRPFKNSTGVDSFDSTERFQGCKFSDYTTSYAGITVSNAQEGGIDSYQNGNRGTVLDLGQNPFLQYGLGEVLQEIGDAIATDLASVAFVPFESTMLCGVEYDLGDVFTMTDGTAGTSSTCMVHQYTWTFNKGCKFKGVGSNPDVGAAKSRYDKMISGMRGSSANEIKYYTFTNSAQYDISDGSTEMILFINFSTVKPGYVVFQCEIHAQVDGEITFKYVLNSANMDFIPIEQFTTSKDNHIVSLFYPFTSQGNTNYELELHAEMSGGSCTIAARDMRALLWGQGLAATDEWTGVIRLEDAMLPITLDNITITAMSDSLTVSTDTPTVINLTDAVSEITLDNMTFLKNFYEGIYFNRTPASDYTWSEFGAECTDWDDALARFLW